MLFNSLEFIFVFLPLAVCGFALIGTKRKELMGAAWLTLASLVFYAFWQADFLPWMALSIALNYFSGQGLVRLTGSHLRKWLLAGSVSANLVVLAYYKYSNFFVTNLNTALGSSLPVLDIALPLGISFFTFTQISYLVDVYRDGGGNGRFVHYCLFVSYFPHLAAGPVLHHREMMPQFESLFAPPPTFQDVAIGLTIFAIGLFKKVVLADGIAPYANLAFGAASAGNSLTFVDGWCGALSYSLQLYFDFSGYSDMAIGISRMLGIHIPVNFDSPYKSTSMIDFWRRWHMSLSRFLRDYLYIPLGGGRHGPTRRYLNLLLTMVLGGFWHGAAWTFIIWGLLHGVFLAINHAWRTFFQDSGRVSRISNIVYWSSTFGLVTIGWVFFRSANLDAAVNMLSGMFGSNGVSLPNYWLDSMGHGGELLRLAGVRGSDMTSSFGGRLQLMWIAALLSACLIMPNTQEIMSKAGCGIQIYSRMLQIPDWCIWNPSTAWALLIAVLFLYSLSRMTEVSEFLYWQF